MSAEKRNHRIILAEDDDASRALLARQLEKAGYDVVACRNGQEALDALTRHDGGIVLADWMMPELDGLTLAKRIRDLNEMQAMPFVYFVLLTSQSETEQIVAGLEAGADDYLTKPYRLPELLARLRAGERIFDLHHQIVKRQIELHRVNAQMATLNQRLERLANTDALTGLYNRRFLFERFQEFWSLSDRSGRPLACVLFDIDRFKSINDAHGHAAGDAVLKAVAGVCRRAIRGHDVAARFGGEEFCVLCPDTDLQGATALAERLRNAVAKQPFTSGTTSIAATVSVGVSIRRPVHHEPDDLLAAADAMLYRAKESGRNQSWAVDERGAPTPVKPAPTPQAA